MENTKIFSAERLKEVMEEKGVTIEDIILEMVKCKVAFYMANKKDYVQDIIDGKRYPSLLGLVAICKAVNVSADYLLNFTNNPHSIN